MDNTNGQLVRRRSARLLAKNSRIFGTGTTMTTSDRDSFEPKEAHLNYKKSEAEPAQRYAISKFSAVRSCADGSRELRVVWKGYKKRTWEPESNLLLDCEEAVKKFLAKHAEKLALSKKRIAEKIARSEMLRKQNYAKWDSPMNEEDSTSSEDSDEEARIRRFLC